MYWSIYLECAEFSGALVSIGSCLTVIKTLDVILGPTYSSSILSIRHVYNIVHSQDGSRYLDKLFLCFFFAAFEDTAYPVYFGKLRMFCDPVSIHKIYV